MPCSPVTSPRRRSAILLDRFCSKASRSGLKPFVTVAQTIRKRRVGHLGRGPARDQQRTARRAQPQGASHRQPRLRLPLREGGPRAHHAHPRTDRARPSPRACTNRRSLNRPTSMPGGPKAALGSRAGRPRCPADHHLLGPPRARPAQLGSDPQRQTGCDSLDVPIRSPTPPRALRSNPAGACYSRQAIGANHRDLPHRQRGRRPARGP